MKETETKKQKKGKACDQGCKSKWFGGFSILIKHIRQRVKPLQYP